MPQDMANDTTLLMAGLRRPHARRSSQRNPKPASRLSPLLLNQQPLVRTFWMPLRCHFQTKCIAAKQRRAVRRDCGPVLLRHHHEVVHAAKSHTHALRPRVQLQGRACQLFSNSEDDRDRCSNSIGGRCRRVAARSGNHGNTAGDKVSHQRWQAIILSLPASGMRPPRHPAEHDHLVYLRAFPIPLPIAFEPIHRQSDKWSGAIPPGD